MTRYFTYGEDEAPAPRSAPPAEQPSFLRPSGGSIDLPPAEKQEFGTLGRFDIDLNDPIGSARNFASQLGVIGAALTGNQQAIPELLSLGEQAVDVASTLPGGQAIKGGIQAGGTLLELAGLPERAVQRTVAGERLRGASLVGQGIEQAARVSPIVGSIRGIFGEGEGQTIPADLQDALFSGAMTRDQVADELVARNAGYSSNPVTNVAASIALDPLNFVGGVLGKGHTIVKGARDAYKGLKTAEELSTFERVAGRSYDVAMRGVNKAGAATMSKLFGPVESGVYRSLGTKPVNDLRGAFREYEAQIDESLALGAAQLPREWVARRLGNDVNANWLDPNEPRDVIAGRVEEYLKARRAINEDEVERGAEELLDSFWLRLSDDEIAPFVHNRMAAALGITPEQAAARLAGVKLTPQHAKTVQLLTYGRAGDDLEAAKNVLRESVAAGGKWNLGRPVDDVVPLAPETMTTQDADFLLANIDDMTFDELSGFISSKRILEQEFGAAAIIPKDKVRAFVEEAREAMPTAIFDPVTRKNPLPEPLQEWLAKYRHFGADDGYRLGFRPAEPWKYLTRQSEGMDEIDRVYRSPWVDFVSDKTPLKSANALGRVTNALFRGVTQTKIIENAKKRFVAAAAPYGISEVASRSMFRAILNEAHSRGVTPRGLVALKENGRPVIERIFEDTGINVRELEVRPSWLVMKAFENDARLVGGTQKLTGKFKSATSQRGDIMTSFAEYYYPLGKFQLHPGFQLQEVIESKVWNTLRGVTPPPSHLAEDVRQFAHEAGASPELRLVFEPYAGMYLAGSDMAAQIGRRHKGLMESVFGNIVTKKQLAAANQAAMEMGPRFRQFLLDTNPEIYRKLADSYGLSTSEADSLEVMLRWAAERRALTKSHDEAMKVIDDAMMEGHIQRAYDEGDVATGQALNRQVGIARGGTAESGGAVKAADEPDIATEETIRAAVHEATRAANMQAFKTHFFNPRRGVIERTVNHPFLGIYPASYMYGKVLPEFIRFMGTRPFGLKAPLAGTAAVHHVQRVLMADIMESEGEGGEGSFGAWLQEHPDTAFLIKWLLPGVPDQIGASMPGWFRHSVRDLATDGELDAERVGQEIASTVKYSVGLFSDLDKLTKVGAELGDSLDEQLTKASAEYDSTFDR